MNNEEFATRLDEIAKELEQLCEVAPPLEFHVGDALFHAEQLSWLATKVRRVATQEFPDFDELGYRAFWDGKPIAPSGNNEMLNVWTFDKFTSSREVDERDVAYTEGWCRAQDELRARSVTARLRKRETPWRLTASGKLTSRHE